MVKKILYGIAGALFLVVIYHSYNLISYKNEREASVREKGLQTIDNLKIKLDSLLLEVTDEAGRLATDFGNNEYTKSEIEGVIKQSALKIKPLQGVTACYEPYALSEEQRLYCPFYNKGQDQYLYVGEGYDYTDKSIEDTAWYSAAIENGAQWVEPYFGTVAKEWYIDYSVPFYYSSGPKKGQVRGIITMSFETKRFKNLIRSMSLGKTGFGILTTTEGNLLSHPVNGYIGTTNLRDLQSRETTEPLIAAYRDILEGKSGNVAFDREENDDEALFYYDTIPSSGWGIAFMFYKNELLQDTAALHHRYVKLALLLSGLLLILIIIYFNKDYLDRTEIWQLSALASILLLANIVFVGYLEHSGTRSKTDANPPIADVGSLDNFVDARFERSEDLRSKKETPIPTGLYISRMDFVNSYDLNVSGTVWQKYPLDIVDAVTPGFLLPQTSPFAEASYIEENHRTRIPKTGIREGYMLIAWDFRVTLQQYLDYRNFPFDKRHIDMEIIPINIADGLLFVPDLTAYEFMGPSRKPGLDQLVRIPGNRILKTYFNYSVESFDADFGLGSKSLFEEVPLLHYNINLRRILLTVFVTYLIPIFVVLIMMFILVIACSKSEERQGIIQAMAAFFFVLIFSHIDMRKEIVTADLIFLEYFYFVSYFMIILATFNLLAYTKSYKRMFDYNENQLFKAVYFPFFFLCVLIVSLAKFH